MIMLMEVRRHGNLLRLEVSAEDDMRLTCAEKMPWERKYTNSLVWNIVEYPPDMVASTEFCIGNPPLSIARNFKLAGYLAGFSHRGKDMVLLSVKNGAQVVFVMELRVHEVAKLTKFVKDYWNMGHLPPDPTLR